MTSVSYYSRVDNVYVNTQNRETT